MCESKHWFSCGADGRSVGGRCTVTWLPNFLGWIDLLSHRASRARGAPLKNVSKIYSIWQYKIFLTAKKIFWCLSTCSCGTLTVKLALEFISIVSEALVVDKLRTAATNNNFGEFTVIALSIKWILFTIVQSRNLLEKLQQHPQCMMVWLNSTSIVSPAIFSNQVLIYGVLR